MYRGSSIYYLYKDNTVVTADALTCRVTGVYAPHNGKVNLKMEAPLANVKVASNKCKDGHEQCAYDQDCCSKACLPRWGTGRSTCQKDSKDTNC